jgi:hypothetical protein
VRSRVGFCLVLLAAAGGALLVAPEQQAKPGPNRAAFPGGPYYVIGCGFSHRNNDDPIVFPGQPGRSHNHTFIGNRTVDASTTPASLRGGPSSCGDLGDASSYWTPTLYVGREPIRPMVGLAYYVKRTHEAIHPFPAGLKMVAGDPDARTAQNTAVVSWTCGGVGSPARFSVVPSCSENNTLQLRVHFPNCWNGRSTDSADHKRHMAYSSGGRCPASHPVGVPTITLLFLYAPVPGKADLSSGRFAAHADFINGWDQEILAGQVAALNRGRPPD